MSPRWKGYTLLPSAAHSAAASETAKAVSVPRLFNRSASTEPPSSPSLECTKCSGLDRKCLACAAMRDGVNSQNWIDGPFNRWGFVHVREVTRTARIGGSTVAPAPLPRLLDTLAGFEFDHRGRRWR